MMKKIFGKTFGGLRIYSYLCSQIKRQGHSPVGLERCSHIAEVPGSSPGVPTYKNPRHTGEDSIFYSKVS